MGARLRDADSRSRHAADPAELRDSEPYVINLSRDREPLDLAGYVQGTWYFRYDLNFIAGRRMARVTCDANAADWVRTPWSIINARLAAFVTQSICDALRRLCARRGGPV